ncbi:glycosyltransferase [Amycolatopsis dongchuanensis]|uniref:Glycosyltransferase n=1 Tax=Amycolatopsis dongchuanensis TaxID=1070866 RepID=A0ABP9QBE8_9PSEU
MPDRTVACTVVSGGRLPTARVLARSYLDRHPGHGFVTFVLDEASPADDHEDWLVAGYDWLDAGQDEYLRLATFLSEEELTAAVVPLVLRQLLSEAEVAVHLAPETDVLAPFADITNAAAAQGIVLVPRLLAPLPADGNQPAVERELFDPGFVAVGRSATAFLDFWADRARREPGTHQRWLDLVPALFPHTVARDAGLGVAHWNLHEDRSGAPVKFLHLSGYDPETPWLLTEGLDGRGRVRLSADGAKLLRHEPEPLTLRQACEDYGRRLLAAGYRKDARYRFDRLPDGSPLTGQMRQLAHQAWLAAHQPRRTPSDLPAVEPPPPAFGPDGGAGFQRWLSSPAFPAERKAGLNRLVKQVWKSRVDLQAVFPRPEGASAEAFRNWCRIHGADEGLVPDWALPVEPDPVPVDAPADEFGVNVAGYLTGELGLGEMGRIVHRTVVAAGVPVVAVVEEDSLALACRTGLAAPETVGRPRFPVSVLAVNADYAALLLESHPEVGHERYRIGLWAWELEEFPEQLHGGFALVDEVWTISEFCRRAIAPHSPVPVKVLPVPVEDPGEPRRQRTAGEPVRFLFVFDYNSTGGRKNPWGVVEAFRRAFPDRPDVHLTIKTTNARLHPVADERLRHLVGDDPRIELIDRYLTSGEFDALYARSDCYVSLHRSEGFGLTVAEAMVRGLAVIATDYSSTTEFLDAETGWPVPHGMTEVGPGWVPYPEDGRWADPDLDEAAAAMRQVADDPAEAYRRGKAARERILRTRSTAVAADWVREQLTAAHATWRTRTSAPTADTPTPGILHRGKRKLLSLVPGRSR